MTASLNDAAELLLRLGKAEKVEVTADGASMELGKDDREAILLAAGLLRRIAGVRLETAGAKER